jgi:23S rRNA (uracil1939-C5)-methyltransferase
MSRRRKPLPEGIFETTINALSHEGRGVATQNGKATFIFGALPNETIRFSYTAAHSRYDEGKTLEVLTSSPDRVVPSCAHFSICGGCSLQHLSAEAQLTLKENTLREQIKHFANTEPAAWLPPLTAKTYGYRRKARLGVRYVEKKSTVLVGFREQQSNFLANLDTCPILHSPVDSLITPLKNVIQSLSVYRQIAQIEVAMGDQDTALVFRHLAPLSEDDKALLISFGTKHNLIIFLQAGKPDQLEKLCPEDSHILLSYDLPEYHLTLHFHPMEFTQINADINRKMIVQALSLLELSADDTVLDLFCGLGNFTLPIATVAKKVVGVEGADSLVKRATFNAAQNNITNADFFAADLSKPLEGQPWAETQYTKLLLDPARTGAKEIAEYLPIWEPKRIVYVSCNPATLARDIGLFIEKGYKLEKAGIMDMFPQTTHVESIALFIRGD